MGMLFKKMCTTNLCLNVESLVVICICDHSSLHRVGPKTCFLQDFLLGGIEEIKRKFLMEFGTASNENSHVVRPVFESSQQVHVVK